jgi:hypothetical protein
MSSFRTIKGNFLRLSDEDKAELLRDLYALSEDTRLFLENRLSGVRVGEKLILRMEKETIGKVYRRGEPQTPRGSAVNALIRKARKMRADLETMLRLEQLAYRGFIEFLNEYGGGPENFEDMACRHLEAYLLLVRDRVPDPEHRKRLLDEMRSYLLAKDNMITEGIDQTYEDVTGERLGRTGRW